MENVQTRGEKFTHAEFVGFVKWVNRFPSKALCAEALDISRPTLDRMLNTGRGRKAAINKVREEISQLV